MVKRYRVRRHKGERGAAVFVVVLAITLLTAVGLFAAHSATLVDQAAGYVRLARQTQYLAEYGALASATELSAGAADHYYRRMLSPPAGTQCSANGGLTAACSKIFYAELATRSGRKLLVDQSGDETDGVGLIGNAHFGDDVTEGTRGDFVVELTDPGPTGAPVAGSNVGGTGVGFRYVKVTATTIAQLRPYSSADDEEVCTNGVATLTSQQALRTHLVIGPIQQ